MFKRFKVLRIVACSDCLHTSEHFSSSKSRVCRLAYLWPPDHQRIERVSSKELHIGFEVRVREIM